MLLACVATKTTPCETSGCAFTSPLTGVLKRRPNVDPLTMLGESVAWFGYQEVRSSSAPCVTPVVDSEDALIWVVLPESLASREQPLTTLAIGTAINRSMATVRSLTVPPLQLIHGPFQLAGSSTSNI